MATRTSTHQRARANSSTSGLMPYLAIFANSWHATPSSNSNRSKVRTCWCTLDLLSQFFVVLIESVCRNRASATAHKIIETASSSYALAQSKVHELSDTMLAELKRVQTGTYQLPSQVQSSLKDVSEGLTTSIHELSGIISSNAPLNEKAGKIKDTVQQKVQPLLDAATSRVQEILKVISSRGQEAKETAEEKVEEKTQNGSANGHTE